MSGAGWALVLYGIYGSTAFGLRALVHQRRTGDAGFRGFSGEVGSPQWFAGILFAVAIVAGLCGPIVAIAGWIEPISASTSLCAIGAGFAAVGISATLAAQFAMGNSWRIGVSDRETTELVTEGPFAFVRNPIFTAMILTALGLTLMVPNLPSILGFVGLIVGLELHVRLIEEPYLARVQGDSYRRYTAQVGRFVPRIGRTQP
jgi:protein-S-isoprenylcysteine O-methyltransferase Ste14